VLPSSPTTNNLNNEPPQPQSKESPAFQSSTSTAMRTSNNNDNQSNNLNQNQTSTYKQDEREFGAHLLTPSTDTEAHLLTVVVGVVAVAVAVGG